MSDTTTTEELILAWSGKRNDNITTLAGRLEKDKGYRETESVGHVFTDPDEAEKGPKSRIALWVGYNQGRSDSRTITSDKKEPEEFKAYHIYDDAPAGYIYEKPVTGCRPLCLAYRGDREDSLTKIGDENADNYGFTEGYDFIRVLGYIKP